MSRSLNGSEVRMSETTQTIPRKSNSRVRQGYTRRIPILIFFLSRERSQRLTFLGLNEMASGSIPASKPGTRFRYTTIQFLPKASGRNRLPCLRKIFSSSKADSLRCILQW